MQHDLKLLLGLVALAITACAPEPPAVSEISPLVTADDYGRAERFLSANTNPLVQHNILAQHWQEDGRLIYRKSTAQGSEYLLVNLETNDRGPLFDNATLAAVLEEYGDCLLYTSPSPRDRTRSRMPSSA